MTTVLIVDDQALQRMGFNMLLEAQSDMTVVGEATNGAEAVRMTAELRPDVVLMDVRMPGMDGIEATRRIVESGDRSRILVLTTFDLDEYAYDALRAGASGFLLKDALPEELVAGVRAVAAGDAVISPASPANSSTPSATASPATPRSSNADWTNSPSANAKSSPPSPVAGPTRRSPNASTSPNRPSSPTSAASSPRSTPATASKP